MTAASRPLEGVKVLDFTWALAGPFGTMLLADLGAEVWKVEPPGITEEERGYGPYLNGVSTYFASVNRGKKSLAIDLKTSAGREIVSALSERADILVESFTPGTMGSLGLDYETLNAKNNRLIYVSLSGFGQTGPYRERGAMDVVIQAMSGLMGITGEPDRPPVRCGYSVADLSAGMFAAVGILAALVERERSGLGQHLDISMLDCQTTMLESAFVRYLNAGEEAERTGSRHPLVMPFQAFPTRDGYMALAGVKDWVLFCHTIERPDLARDERFATNDARIKHVLQLETTLSESFRARSTAEWQELLAYAALVAPVNGIADAARDPQTIERGMFADVADGWGGAMSVVNSPFKFSRSVSGPQGGVPRLGEHTSEVLGHSHVAITAEHGR